MKELQQLKQQASRLRKNNELEEALSLYEELFRRKTKDKFDAAGYLHCLRKLKLHTEALKVATECEQLFSDFNWCRLEIMWTYISEIKRVEETESITSILSIATKIMNLKPDDIQTNITVLAVLKKAKQLKRWDISCLWIDKVNPETLDKTSFVVDGKSTVWSEYLIWQKHKVTCLNYQKKHQEAIEQLEKIRKQTIQVKKYFLVLEVDALIGIGKENKAINILKELTQNPKVDWWVVYRFAIVLKNTGKKELALKEMYRAANLSYKLENSINLLMSIFLLAKELNRMEEAYYHLLLFKLIREKKSWTIQEEIHMQISLIGNNLSGPKLQNYPEVLKKCRSYWSEINNIALEKSIKVSKNNLNGSLVQVKEGRAFCFIKTSKDSFFCHRSEIKGDVVEGMTVKFDAIPTYNKKKQQESWKAINVVRM